MPNGKMVELKASSEMMIIFPGIIEDNCKGFKQNFVAARNGCKNGRQSEKTFIF